MIEFITHGIFILRLSEIKYIELQEDVKIVVTIQSNNQERKFIMEYLSVFSAKNAFNKLILDTDAFLLEDNWRHPFVNQMSLLRNEMSDIQLEFEKMSKEISLTRKLFRDKNKKKGIKSE
jgi:hypothetical protein